MHPCPSGSYQDEQGQSNCKLCPPGYYCNATIISTSTYEDNICPSGFYCPNGTQFDNQYPCPQGTYNSLKGQSSPLACLPCLGGFSCSVSGIDVPNEPCAPGFYCKKGSSSPVPNNDASGSFGVCPEGHFCPEQSMNPLACPRGTFNLNEGADGSDKCLNCTAGFFCSSLGLTEPVNVCPAGYFCPEGTVQPHENICPAGTYCPQGSSHPFLCPPGTFSIQSGLSSFTLCQLCPSGKFCQNYGLIEPEGNCSRGHYCPSGSKSSTAISCPAGKFCPEGVGSPLECADGTYSDVSGKAECETCPGGYYCVHNYEQNNTSATIHLCPPGFFCKNATGLDWIPCPPGSYSGDYGLSDVNQCKPCKPGMYCNGYNLTSPTGNCEAGYFCESAAIVKNPINESICHDDLLFPVRGNVCPQGHFCPEASHTPQICDAGSYQDTVGQSTCNPCIAGYFCKEGTIYIDQNPCPSGYFCPPESKRPLPCPPGTFNNQTKAASEKSCVPCPGGLFCQDYGLIEPTGPCKAGWYCSSGSKTATPSSGSGGDKCPSGHYCPSASISPVICPAEHFCEENNLALPSGKCRSGYYCLMGSKSREQFICDVGHYCVNGKKIPCPTGTLGIIDGLASKNECIPCPPGHYCARSGSSNSTGPCSENYYCPGGQEKPENEDLICPPGHRCPISSSEPIPCNNGHFQNLNGQAYCKPCPMRYFCENLNGTGIIDPSNFPCVEGHYCPEGTRHRYQYKCPPSTYSDVKLLQNASECKKCPPKYYCQNQGLMAPEGLCQAGYFCNGSSASPMDNICPENMYCPTGTDQPLPCPDGSLAEGKSGNQNVTQCEPCPRGFFCKNLSRKPCSGGFICVTGSTTSRPVDDIHGYPCPEGHYCLEGGLKESPCLQGYYMPLRGKSSCFQCPIGSVCPTIQMNHTEPCDVGQYCNETGLTNGHLCPVGTYNNKRGATDISSCKPCEPGFYCSDSGLAAPSGRCNKGYLCLSGAINPTPDGSDGINLPCPRGKFCVEGTTAAENCPAGTINGNIGATSLDECQPCPAGFYCNETGSISPTGPCHAGYFCPSNETIQDPKPSNFQCPSGHICPVETADPIGCPPGTFQPNQQYKEESCLGCPKGYFCTGNTSAPAPCPPHSYCPANSSFGMLCPNGRYTPNDTVKLESSDDCFPCKTGFYCIDGKLTAPCSAGYWCLSGSDSPTPSGIDDKVGKPCPFGFFCPEGTLVPQKCKNGTFIGIIGATSENDCGKCPPGTLCPDDAKEPTQCAPGE